MTMWSTEENCNALASATEGTVDALGRGWVVMLRRLLALIVGLVSTFAAIGLAEVPAAALATSPTGTATASAAGYVYDAPVGTPVDGRSFLDSAASPTWLGQFGQGFGLQDAGAPGRSTTPPVTLVATNTAGGLSEISPGVYRSGQGLTYGPGSAQGHRVTHVMEHARPVSGKPVHSVFKTSATDLPGLTDEVLGIVDDAWAIRGPSVPGDPGRFVVPMGRTVGTTGQTSVTIIVKPGTSEIITAFPS